MLVNEVPVGFSKREEIILQQYFQQTKDCNADYEKKDRVRFSSCLMETAAQSVPAAASSFSVRTGTRTRLSFTVGMAPLTACTTQRPVGNAQHFPAFVEWEDDEQLKRRRYYTDAVSSMIGFYELAVQARMVNTSILENDPQVFKQEALKYAKDESIAGSKKEGGNGVKTPSKSKAKGKERSWQEIQQIQPRNKKDSRREK